MSLKTHQLNEQIKTSDSVNEVKNDTSKALMEASRILWLAKQSWDKKLISKFEKEYKDLETQIQISIQENSEIAEKELTRIKLEFSNIITLADKNNLIDWYYTHKAKTIWEKTIREKTQDIFTKTLYNFTKEEALWALEYLNSEYSGFKNANIIDKGFAQAVSDNSIDELKTKYEIKLFQEQLIKKIIWNNSFKKWYNNKLLRGFNNKENWNFLTTISDFESNLYGTNASEINSMVLANYFKYLSSTNSLNKEKLLTTFWKSTLIQLWKLWEHNSDDKNKQIAKKELEKKWLWSIVEKMVDFTELFNSNDTTSFLKNAKTLTPKETENAKKFILKNPILKKKFLETFSWYCPISQTPWKEILENTLKVEHRERLKKEKQQILNVFKEKFNLNEKIANELFEKLQKNIINNPCAIDSINIIDNINKKIKEQNSNSDTKIPIISNSDFSEINWLMIDYTSNSVKYKQEELYATDISNYSADELNTHNEKINNNTLLSTGLERAWTTNNFFDTKTVQKVREQQKQWKTNEEIMQYLRKENKELDQALIQHEEKYKEHYNKKEKNEQNTKNIEPKEITDKQPAFEEKDFIEKGWQTIVTTHDEKEIPITKEEKKLLIWNKKATNNLINFYNFFENLNLLSVWKYRKELMTAAWNVNINPDSENYIDNEELRKFWNELLKFIAKLENKPFVESNTLNDVKEKLRIFSWSNSVMGDSKTFNIEWEDKLASYLRNQWIIGWMYFKINEYRKKLIQKKLTNKNVNH